MFYTEFENITSGFTSMRDVPEFSSQSSKLRVGKFNLEWKADGFNAKNQNKGVILIQDAFTSFYESGSDHWILPSPEKAWTRGFSGTRWKWETPSCKGFLNQFQRLWGNRPHGFRKFTIRNLFAGIEPSVAIGMSIPKSWWRFEFKRDVASGISARTTHRIPPSQRI